MHTNTLRLTLATIVALITLTACGATPAPETQASTSAPSGSPSSTTLAGEQDSSVNAAEPSGTDATNLSLNSISVDITDVQEAKLAQPAGRTLPGTAGLQVKLKITNTSDGIIDAAALSFPTLTLDDGTKTTGFALTQDGTETTYGLIEPGTSEELTIFFPTDQVPSALSITLLNPVEPGQTLTVETDL